MVASEHVGIAPDSAALISIALEGILYGVSALMFAATVHITLANGKKLAYWMVIVSGLFFMLSTAHVVVDLCRLYQGFISERHTVEGPPGFFANVATMVFVVKSALYLLQTLLGDGVVIYRCYIVWQKKWIIVLPLLTWCSVAVCGAVLLFLLSDASRGAGTTVFVFKKWITAYFTSSLVANLLSTGLLAFRIWQMDRRSAMFKANKSLLLPVLRTVIDSGAMYSVTLTIALVTFLSNSNSQYIVIDMLVPIIAIAFYLIIIRLTLNANGWGTSHQKSSGAHHGPYSSNDYPLRPVQVHISQLSESEVNKDRNSDHMATARGKAGVYGEA